MEIYIFTKDLETDTLLNLSYKSLDYDSTRGIGEILEYHIVKFLQINTTRDIDDIAEIKIVPHSHRKKMK